MAVLVIADHDGATLRETTAKTVTAALKLGGDIDIAVLGGSAAVAEAASRISGARASLRRCQRWGFMGKLITDWTFIFK